jgi:hypothetical protein
MTEQEEMDLIRKNGIILEPLNIVISKMDCAADADREFFNEKAKSARNFFLLFSKESSDDEVVRYMEAIVRDELNNYLLKLPDDHYVHKQISLICNDALYVCKNRPLEQQFESNLALCCWIFNKTIEYGITMEKLETLYDFNRDLRSIDLRVDGNLRVLYYQKVFLDMLEYDIREVCK